MREEALELELKCARADNAALLRRLVLERRGAQTQLESAVAHWTEKLDRVLMGCGGELESRR